MSVSFESAAVQVTAGHRTVLCVVLEGLPGGGMTQDLSVSTQLVNRTAGKPKCMYLSNNLRKRAKFKCPLLRGVPYSERP